MWQVLWLTTRHSESWCERQTAIESSCREWRIEVTSCQRLRIEPRDEDRTRMEEHDQGESTVNGMKRMAWTALLAIVAIVSAAHSAAAQVTATGTIDVIVQDQGGLAVPGANVV